MDLCLRNLAKSLEGNSIDVLVYLDGPKSGDDLQIISEVYRVVQKFHNIMRLSIVRRDTNLGLADSVISGIDNAFTQYNKLIVIEDDIIVSKHFINFCLDALLKFEHKKSVAAIQGYLPELISQKLITEPFFIQGAYSWGWATWKDRWDSFEKNEHKLLNEILNKNLSYHFDFENSFPFTSMLKQQTQRMIDSWAIRWYASMFLQKKFSLFPSKSLVKNIGNDSSGTHASTNNIYDTSLPQDAELIPHEIQIKEDTKIKKFFIEYYRILSVNSTNPVIILKSKIKIFIKRVSKLWISR